MFDRFKCEYEVKTTKEDGVGHIPWLTTLWGRGVCWSFKMGLGRMTNTSSLI
jgi:hypothetical protein